MLLSESLPNFTSITDENFQQEVLHHDGITLVVFYREDCSSCHIFAPTISTLEQAYRGKFKPAIHNVGKGSYFQKKYGFTCEPTTAVFYAGEMQGHAVGASGVGNFEPQLQALLAQVTQRYNLPPITRAV